MPGNDIDYELKTQEELVTLAAERGEGSLENYRRVELRRLLRALDAGDQADAEAVRSAAAERTKKQSSKGDDVMARAAANAGKPVASKPKADRALEKPAKEGAGASTTLLVEGAGSARQPLVVKGGQNDGRSVIERMMARREANKLPAPTGGVPVKRSLALAALEAAHQGGTGKPLEQKPVPHFEVLEATRYFAAHGIYHLPAGSIVSSITHDMESLRSNGAKLRQIDPAKTSVEYSDLGFPRAMKTVAAPEGSQTNAKVAS